MGLYKLLRSEKLIPPERSVMKMQQKLVIIKSDDEILQLLETFAQVQHLGK